MTVSPPAQAKRMLPRATSNFRLFLETKTKRRTKTSSWSTRILAGGPNRHGVEGGSMALPAVETETVNGAGTPFAIVTEEGTWHAALRGAPLQASETVPPKPAPGLSCSWY